MLLVLMGVWYVYQKEENFFLNIYWQFIKITKIPNRYIRRSTGSILKGFLIVHIFFFFSFFSRYHREQLNCNFYNRLVVVEYLRSSIYDVFFQTKQTKFPVILHVSKKLTGFVSFILFLKMFSSLLISFLKHNAQLEPNILGRI